MATNSLAQMLEEIAQGLRTGDQEIWDWLQDQLKECGATDMCVELAMGVIARLVPETTKMGVVYTVPEARRWAH